MLDDEYWKNFYKENNLTNEPSGFCMFIMDYFKDEDKMNILDAGCGNGRDGYALATKHNVIGVDRSSFKPEDNENCKFLVSDFCSYDKTNFDLVYSRFTFHSIKNEDHDILLNSIKNDTYLCIETRSDKGMDENRYYGDDHYRNFTNIEYLKDLLVKYQFEIMYIEEEDNFAIYKNENPICIRVICKKQIVK